jgi:hypothetical protein
MLIFFYLIANSGSETARLPKRETAGNQGAAACRRTGVNLLTADLRILAGSSVIQNRKDYPQPGGSGFRNMRPQITLELFFDRR